MAFENPPHEMDRTGLQRYLCHETPEVIRIGVAAPSEKEVQERAKRISPVDNWRIERKVPALVRGPCAEPRARSRFGCSESWAQQHFSIAE